MNCTAFSTAGGGLNGCVKHAWQAAFQDRRVFCLRPLNDRPAAFNRRFHGCRVPPIAGTRGSCATVSLSVCRSRQRWCVGGGIGSRPFQEGMLGTGRCASAALRRCAAPPPRSRAEHHALLFAAYRRCPLRCCAQRDATVPRAQGSIRRTQKFVNQKWSDQVFPIVNFVVSHDGHFGGVGGGFPRGLPPFLRCPAIRTLPCS